MDIFTRALRWTMLAGMFLLGIWTGILFLRVAISVVGFLLGSSLGTVILALILWHWYERHKDDEIFK